MEDTSSKSNWLVPIAALVAGAALMYALTTASGEDEPIIIAGGSTHVHADKGKFKKASNTAEYQNAGVKVRRVDFGYWENGVPRWGSKKGDLKVTLGCPPTLGCQSLQFQKNGAGVLTLSDSGDLAEEGQDISLQTTLHSVTVEGEPIHGCTDKNGQDGKCWVVIHACKSSLLKGCK